MATKYPTKCEGCGGNLVFDPKTVSLKCQNCGNFVPVRLVVAKEKDYIESEINESAWTGETKTIKCNSCGAIDVMNRGDMADVCPFCGSSNIIDSSENAGLVPDGIMPFSISKEEAIASFNGKVRKSLWAPKDFKQSVSIEKIKAVYTPAFTFDSFALGTYSGRLGRDEQVTSRTMSGNLTTETETRWFNVNGTIRKRFDDVLITAGQMIGSTTIQELEPFNTNASIEYNEVFLNGCSANSYKKNLKTSFNQALQIMKMDIREDIIKQYSADRVASLDIEMDCAKTKYKYLLLPVYISGYRYNDKNYNVYVNGTTGKVAGKLPVSKKKVFWATMLGILAGVGVACALLLL